MKGRPRTDGEWVFSIPQLSSNDCTHREGWLIEVGSCVGSGWHEGPNLALTCVNATRTVHGVERVDEGFARWAGSQHQGAVPGEAPFEADELDAAGPSLEERAPGRRRARSRC